VDVHGLDGRAWQSNLEGRAVADFHNDELAALIGQDTGLQRRSHTVFLERFDLLSYANQEPQYNQHEEPPHSLFLG
jgi:hypothetical protein